MFASGGVLDNAELYEGLDQRLQGVEGDIRNNKEHLECLDHRMQGLEGLDYRVQSVEMTTIVLLGIGTIIAVLVIVTTMWWMCYQRKDKPSSPCNLQVVKVCTDYVCVTWQAPMSDGNSPITRYVVEKADTRTPTFTIAGHTDSDTQEFKMSQLNKGKQYLIRVFAENAIGQSEPVSVQEPVRLPLEPSPPCNLQVVEVCADYVCLTWQAPMSDGNSPITRYVVDKADARTPNFTIAGHTDSDTLEFKVSQLNKGKQYLIRVFAENAIGQSEPVSVQEPVRLPLEPSPPCNLQVVEVCADYVCLTWQAPMSDGNSPITRYVVDKADARTPTFTIAGHTDSDTLEFKLSQLNKGQQYLIRVFAENAIGQSEPVSVQEPVRLPLEPSPPCNLQVVEDCADYVCVTWQAPMSDGNSPITRYVVETADTSTTNFTIAGHTDRDTHEFKLSQLNKGKQYLIRVFAENAIGQSELVSLEEPVQLPLGELEKFEKRLKVVQQHKIEDYLTKKQDANVTVKDLDELYVDLRIHNKNDNYNRLETRTHYDLLELQKDVASCYPIKVNDLFLPEQEGAATPRRVLVIGKAGIGKTMLTMHILDKWVNGHLMSTYRHVFYFALRDLSQISQSSLTDLFFELHDDEIPKPSDDASAEFFKDVTANPGNCLVILDGADEFGEIDLIRDKFEPKQVVDMRTLLSSVIQGKTLGRADVLVTSRPGGIKDTSCFDKTAEIYGLTQDKIFEYISKFCRGDEDLKTSIEDHISGNTNIASLCYIPVQCDLVCRTVRTKKNYPNKQLPETITQLYTMAVTNLVNEHHPLFKGKEVEDDVNAVGMLREPLLSHAKLARDGMGESPVKMTAEDVLELVVQRELGKTGRDHKLSVLLILLLLFESRCPELWSSVSDYVMEDDKTLDLSTQHISPVELQAVTFIFHIGDFNALDLGFCRLSGRETRRLAGAISMLTRLQSLRLGYNDFSDPTTGEALAESLLKLNTLKKLSRCLHQSPPASLIGLNYRLPHLSSVAPLPCYTSGLLHQWPATQVACYTSSLHQWPATPVACYTSSLLHQWPATPVACYTSSLLHQ
ncbi:hypothetical protein LSAT2_010679 [Lamellibrachia satsuma]|nr:hypothetical protein LSAT2_010679 [Lamellibrachia satsuma]